MYFCESRCNKSLYIYIYIKRQYSHEPLIDSSQRPLLHNPQQRQKRDIPTPSGIWTSDPSNQAVAALRLRLHVHRDQNKLIILTAKQDRHYTCNVTLSSVRATIAAIEKQYHIFRVCICILKYPACDAYAMRVGHIVICGLPDSTIFFHIISRWWDDFWKEVFGHKMCVLILSTTLSEILIIVRINERGMIKMFIDIHVKCRLFLPGFNEIWIFLNRFFKNTQISNFTKIRPVGADL